MNMAFMLPGIIILVVCVIALIGVMAYTKKKGQNVFDKDNWKRRR